MTTKILSSNRLLAVSFLGAALFISGALTVQASSPFDIEFPIPELGNCADRDECKAYCDSEAHENACRAFAEKHGLSSSDDSDRDDEKFIEAVKDGGPGRCALGTGNPLRACEAYCNQSANMRECVLYAKTHDLMDADDLEDAERVIRALDSGVPLPAACSDVNSCKDVCENPKDVSTMRQCFAFAQAAGLLPDDVNPEQAEAMFRAIEEGRAPFRSPKDFEQCENPPNDAVFEKCIAFALESGILPPEEAEMIRKTGGKGPGGCRGERECNAYCENEANREACFAFAIEHDLLSAEDKRRMEEGKQEARRALKSAPPEVLSCIESAIGHDELEKVKNAEGFFTPRLGEIVPRCFDSVLGGQEHTGPFNRGTPPEAVDCMRRIFGNDFEARLRAGEIDPGEHDDEIRACIEEQFGEGYLNDNGEYERPHIGGDDAFPRPPEDFSRPEFHPEFQGGGEYPEGMYPMPGEFGEYPDGIRPPAPPSPEEYERYRSEYETQYQGQFEEQFKEEYQRQYEQYQQQYQEYPSEYNMPPPPPPENAPTSFRSNVAQFASVIAAFLGLSF